MAYYCAPPSVARVYYKCLYVDYLIFFFKTSIIYMSTRPCLNRVHAPEWKTGLPFTREPFFFPVFPSSPRLNVLSTLLFPSTFRLFPGIQGSHIILTTFLSPPHLTILKAPYENKRCDPLPSSLVLLVSP